MPDKPEVARDAVAEALRGSDLVVTIGGVSVGDHDVMRGAFEAAGVTLDFWRVAIKPGKPIAVGRDVGRAARAEEQRRALPAEGPLGAERREMNEAPLARHAQQILPSQERPMRLPFAGHERHERLLADR